MFKIIKFFFLLFFIYSCEKSSVIENPYILDINFEKTINLNLPLYDNLRYNGGSHYINGLGLKGVILFNLNNNYIAWEASCPNHQPSSCSTMVVEGVQTKCNCESNIYSLANGQILSNNTKDSYPLVMYFTEKSGSNLRIHN